MIRGITTRIYITGQIFEAHPDQLLLMLVFSIIFQRSPSGLPALGSNRRRAGAWGASQNDRSSALSRCKPHCKYGSESWGPRCRTSKGLFLERQPAYEEKKEPIIKSRGSQIAAVKTKTSNNTTNRKLHFPSLCGRSQASSQLWRK